MTPNPTSGLPIGRFMPQGSWRSRAEDSTAGVRVGSRRIRFTGSVERFSARLVIERSGAAALTGRVPDHPLFDLRFHAHDATRTGDAIELDGLFSMDGSPVRVVARGALRRTTGDRRHLTLETVFDRRQLGIHWDDLDDEVVLYVDLELERER